LATQNGSTAPGIRAIWWVLGIALPLMFGAGGWTAGRITDLESRTAACETMIKARPSTADLQRVIADLRVTVARLSEQVAGLNRRMDKAMANRE